MVYCFNRGIGWASSGVEYAQSYRANLFRKAEIDAKFIFTNMFRQDHIEYLAKNIGFLDSEIIWLYLFFTDIKMTPVTYTVDDLLSTIPYNVGCKRTGSKGRIELPEEGGFYTVYFVDDKSEYIHRVEIVSGKALIRKDYFTYTRIFSEYYAPLDGKAHLYQRRFFNEDGSVAYEEIIDGENDSSPVYKFKDNILYSKEELVGFMLDRLNLTKEDTILIDRQTEIGQPILSHAGEARVGIMVHADHFLDGFVDEDYILWNNYYEYGFSMHSHIDFYVVATDWQNKVLSEQFETYVGKVPTVYTIPVGSIDKLHYPNEQRKQFSVLSAGRIVKEKHFDLVIEAVVKARDIIPNISLDIYGKGAEEENLRKLIKKHEAGEYIRLMGQQDLKDVYQSYELYLSGSQSEGFGLTLMEAIGGGLPIIGFRVRYGNPTFVDDEKNGYLIDMDDDMSDSEKVNALADRVIKLFSREDRDGVYMYSYEKAKGFLTEEVVKRWKKLIG